jgi:hypothetical protein
VTLCRDKTPNTHTHSSYRNDIVNIFNTRYTRRPRSAHIYPLLCIGAMLPMCVVNIICLCMRVLVRNFPISLTSALYRDLVVLFHAAYFYFNAVLIVNIYLCVIEVCLHLQYNFAMTHHFT